MRTNDAGLSFVERDFNLLDTFNCGNSLLHILGTMAAVHSLYIIDNARSKYFIFVMMMMMMMMMMMVLPRPKSPNQKHKQ